MNFLSQKVLGNKCPPPPCLALRLYLSEKILKWGFQHHLQSFTDPTPSGLPPTHDIIYIFFWVHKTWISVKLGSHVFCIWSICIWSKDTQRSQNLETTVAPNLNYGMDWNNPRDIMARFFNLSQKLAPTRKIVPTDQHCQHVFATLLHRLSASSEEKIKGPE